MLPLRFLPAFLTRPFGPPSPRGREWGHPGRGVPTIYISDLTKKSLSFRTGSKMFGKLHAGVSSEAAVDGQDDAGDDDDLTGEIHESGED